MLVLSLCAETYNILMQKARAQLASAPRFVPASDQERYTVPAPAEIGTASCKLQYSRMSE